MLRDAIQLRQLLLLIVRIVIAEHLGVRVHDQFPSVAVALPFGDQLSIDACFPQPANQILTHGALRKSWITQSITRRRERFLCILDGEHGTIGRHLACLGFQPFEQWAQMGINWDVEQCGRFSTTDVEISAFPIHVTPHQRGGLRLSQSGQAKELNEIGRIVGMISESLTANGIHDGTKLMLRWN